ncbi:hypothetical protein ACSS6W_007114 [Trichoderma asperelloides]
MASENKIITSEFELLNETGQGTLFAIKKDGDPGVRYIAQPHGILNESDVEDTDKQKIVDETLAFYNLLYDLKVSSTISQIFNHENIVSIAGYIKTRPVAAGSERAHLEEYIVWDYCDASNLSALFQSKPYSSTKFYLPESLCWHVLTSLLSAITYLHDGKRLFLDTKATAGDEKRWESVDQDWHPILHRAIEPRNIFFQHPRGIETYGLCKLGNFEHAVVTNHVITPSGGYATEQDVEISRAMAPYRGLETLDMTRHQLLESAETYTAENRPYTIADELFSIGSVIFTMMTGQKPVPSYENYSRCHITSSSPQDSGQTPCNQQNTTQLELHPRPRHPSCHEPTINTDSYLARAQYSEQLRDMVRCLLDCGPGSSRTQMDRVLPTTMLAMQRYQHWKLHSEPGKLYKDIEDDMAARCGAKMRMER